MLDTEYARLDVKAFDDATRTFSGIATTPTMDRQGDVLEPLGVTFQNPIVLLFHHDRERPIGTATLGTPTPEGIPFTASIPTIDVPGPLRDRTDEAWQTVKAGLIRGVSVGYRILKNGADLLKGGRLHLKKTELVELSLVTIPANVDATITAIKSLDASHAAAFGPHPPRVTGTLPVVRAGKAAPAMGQTITEQITAYEHTRAAKDARMVAIMNKSAEASTTLDAAETEEYDGLEREIQSIDAHLVRLHAMEDRNKKAAVPVTKGADPITGRHVITVKANVEPGTGFVRYCQALAACKGNKLEAAEYAKRWDDSTPEVALGLKAAVAAGTTTDAVWAGPLAVMQPLANEFLELLRPATILGKIGAFKRVPFNVSMPSQTGGGSYGWVGQGAPKPVGKLTFGTVTLGITKCAGIIVITEELARTSSPSAEAVIRADMIAGIAAFLDAEFTDPTKAAIAGVSPGSVTNGVTPITSAGTSGANAVTDIQAMAAAIVAAGHSIASAVLLTSETNALVLANAKNPLGQLLFPSLTINGGTGPFGIPVYPSQTMGVHNIMLAPPSILYADDGGVTIDVSREASVQMDTAPDNPAVATTVLTSLWQNNLVGLRAERFINWKKARAGCVAFVDQTYVG